MRTARLFGDGVSYYHCTSRVVDKKYIFSDYEKTVFRKMMRKMEAFAGVEVVTYVVMSNHFHLLLKVDSSVVVDDEEVIRRVGVLYDKEQSLIVETNYREMLASGNIEGAQELINRYRHRMNNLSQFMKELKQRYSISFNKRHGRRGTLWEERFGSLLVEGKEMALSMTAAYIELNPVRACLVEDPKDYLFSGYGEACAGKKLAQTRLTGVLKAMGKNNVKGWGSREYRTYLFEQGSTYQKGGTAREAFRDRAEKVLEKDGKLPLGDLLHCRVRYFSAGVAFGSLKFINDLFKKNRSQFGSTRKTGARLVPCANCCAYTLRDLRLRAITPPPAAPSPD